MVPGDRDVDESLEEVALTGVARAPRVLEGLVRGVELRVLDQREAVLVRLVDGVFRHAATVAAP